MGERGQRILIVALIAVVLALALLGGPGASGAAEDPRRSSFHAAPAGMLALLYTVRELGLPTERRVTSWVEREPLGGTLVVLAPSQPLSPLEIDSLFAWLRAGGRLIHAARPGDPLLDALGLALEPVARPAHGVARPRPHRWAEDADPVEGFGTAFAASSPAFAEHGAVTVLEFADGRAGLLELRFGDGRVAVWSDAAPLANSALRESGAAVPFARSASDLAGSGPLVFDEFHHGYREGAGVAGTVLRWLRDSGPGRMALQLGVVGAGLLLLMGRRFGEPYPPPPALRRSPLEHVEALAGAYRQGGARGPARRQTIAGLARRLGRPVPAPGAESGWLRSLAPRDAAAREAAERLVAEWERGDGGDLVLLAEHADLLAARLRRPRSRIHV